MNSVIRKFINWFNGFFFFWSCLCNNLLLHHYIWFWGSYDSFPILPSSLQGKPACVVKSQQMPPPPIWSQPIYVWLASFKITLFCLTVQSCFLLTLQQQLKRHGWVQIEQWVLGMGLGWGGVCIVWQVGQPAPDYSICICSLWFAVDTLKALEHNSNCESN